MICLLNYFLTVASQIFAMFLMVAVGFILYKRNMLTENGVREMSSLLLKIVTPMIIMSSFQREFDYGLFIEWSAMFLVSLLTYIISIAVAEVFFRNKSTHALAESKLGAILPNCGFLAFPLMQALAGDIGIFYGSTSVILLNIIQWTYGVRLLKPHEKIGARRLFVNPGVIAVVLSLILFISPVKLSAPVFQAVSAIGSLNTPVAMIVLGAMLAQTDIKSAFFKTYYYKIAFLKLILIPMIMIVVLRFLPLSDNVRLIAFICSVVPTATALSMLSQIFDKDYIHSTNTVVISTVLSVITMPILLTMGKVFLGY